jgi:signal transduction histidine kinase
VDKLNSLSYAFHYRNIDSTEYYANEAWKNSEAYCDGRAEALNNLAFVQIVRMNYEQARHLLHEVMSLTDNQIELLVAEVQQMRLCQRRSENRAFYEHLERATTHLMRINEERGMLSDRQQQRIIYAESEMAIVTSTYYYYVGLERQSIEALLQLNLDEVRRDTAQYLNYLYNVGAGGILTEGTPEQIRQEETEYLERCLTIARRHRYPYFEAQALEALADHTGDLQQAEQSLQLFQEYGDVYQIAGAYRTLASSYHALGDDRRALENLHLALSDTVIQQAPDLVASIREQLSVAYSAVNDKHHSDYNRNIYIDLQEQTRQDRELEARAAMLDTAVGQLNLMILAVMGAIVLLVFLLWLFNRLNRKRKEDHQLDDLLEQRNEEVAEARLRVEKNERRHLEQRAKVSLAMSILPLIDRILYTIEHLPSNIEHLNHHGPSSDAEMDYIRELTDRINEQNDLLTQWIQLRQGEVSLHIESFPLQELFDLVSRSKRGFMMKNVELQVEPTATAVKADRVLTLFMLNTLADNARKFTSEGGRVTISAAESDDYVEISVRDTGAGMTGDELAHVFDNKPIRDESDAASPGGKPKPQGSHGFGLMNCKGIIEKYRKMSRLFSVCVLAADSQPGQGSRFYFRLPKGIRRAVGLLCLVATLPSFGQSAATDYLSRAHVYADSAYFSNINGTFGRTLQFADSCRKYLNLQYASQQPKGKLLMVRDGDSKSVIAEIVWLHEGIDTNYQIILDIRNESAVAALALHEWSLYEYNNKVYTQLFKEMSADNTLGDYCRTMQQSQTNKRIAVILLLVLLVLIMPAYYLLYYRHRLYERFRRERIGQTNLEMADDELRRAELECSNLYVSNAVLDNCLSTLKHETMYYPSRIRQLVDTGDVAPLGEVSRYYRELYSLLIQQAIAQVERIHLHIRPVSFRGHVLLCDENLLRYLFELLSGDVSTEVKDSHYVVCHVTLKAPLAPLTSLLVRQIVRDVGEATHRRGCGVGEDEVGVHVVLPLARGN